MSDAMYLVKSQGLLLAPFLNTVVLYFAFVRDPHGELWTTILKCLPITMLMLYNVLKGFAFTKHYRYSQLVLIGLVFSCAGDALLNIDLFPHGMGAFAVAQIFYISAFGWKPLKLIFGLPMYLLAIVMVVVVFKRLDPVLAIGFPIYAALLSTMCWRSIVQGAHKKDFISIFCAVGSVVFVISDGLIGVDMFIVPVPHSRIWIMSTYYLAQFAITLSTAKDKNADKVAAD